MSVEVVSGTPLAQALHNAVQPKLAEVGWSTGAADDSALSEYIILMLVNGKTQDQIASELSNDLLGLGPDDPSTIEFAKWLFEQVNLSNAQLNGGSVPQQALQLSQLDQTQSAGASGTVPASTVQDMDMDEGTTEAPSDGAVPTGPKSMRNGNQQRTRDRRILGQVNKTLNQNRAADASLHRIRGAAGAGRIGNKEPPKGPRSMASRINGAANGNGRPMGQQNGAMNSSMNPMMAADPQQQMQLLKLLEEQSRMMAQILGPNAQQFVNMPAINPAFVNNQASGKSLFERVQGQRRQNQPLKNRQPRQAQGDVNMETDAPADGDADSEAKEPPATPCRFQLSCTNHTCPYGHQSPAAPPGIALDLSDKCSYGAACMNKKCVASHPSPAQKRQHLATSVDCKFYPNCTNPSCPFKHPSTPPCRNGADCPTRDKGCKFSHSDVVCRYNPCLNPNCPFKHADGQKRGAFSDKVWTPANSSEGFDRESAERAHLSDRKFVNEGDEEELILPGAAAAQTSDAELAQTSGRTSPGTLADADIAT